MAIKFFGVGGTIFWELVNILGGGKVKFTKKNHEITWYGKYQLIQLIYFAINFNKGIIY